MRPLSLEFAYAHIRAGLGRVSLSIVADSTGLLNQPESTIVGRECATRRNVGRGSVLPLVTPTGVVPFTIRGLIEPVGVARALEGRLIVMDLFAAQRYFTADHQIS